MQICNKICLSLTFIVATSDKFMIKDIFIPMKQLLTLLLILLAGVGFSQSTEDLEQQLKEAETGKEKMLLNYQLGEKYLRSDTKKALDYAKAAHSMASSQKNTGMAARSAFLTARVYERKRDKRNQEVWLKSTIKLAKAAGDSDLIIKGVEERAQLAIKDRNHRRASDIYSEAFTYFSQKGTSLSDLESKYALSKSQLSKEQRQLEKERNSLLEEVASLQGERSKLADDKRVLTAQKQQLAEAKEQAEETLTEKEEALASIEEEKQQLEEDRKKKERRIRQLDKEAIADSLALAEESLRNEILKRESEHNQTLRNYVLIGAAFLVVLLLFFMSLYTGSRRSKRKLEEKNKIIEQERERSDELLHNILPATVAKELKDFGKAKARQYKEVTVLFSDFQNFTRISEQLGPEELVQELDKCFKAFDFIISQYKDIEKIKTIGDAYMCASGLNNERRGVAPNNLIRAAMEMQEFLDEQKQERLRIGKPFFEARIGIHTGPVVAGVVGVNKFAYDIWGDTVNIAARMESKSQTGRVNISESTYRKVKYTFECSHRGKVEAKNKGMIDMYFVERELKAVTV